MTTQAQTVLNNNNKYSAIVDAAETAVDEDQNWKEETSIFKFEDGSVLWFHGEEIEIFPTVASFEYANKFFQNEEWLYYPF